MGHHIPALPPPVPLTAPKIETPRWRPRIRPDAQGPDGAHAPDSDAVFAAGDALDGKPGRQPGGRKAGQAIPRRGALTAQALTDDTLRTLLLIGQQDTLNGPG